MKCTFKIAVSTMVFGLTLCSLPTHAMNSRQGITSNDLRHIRMKTGKANPEALLTGEELEKYHQNQHRNVFAQTLGKINSQAEKFQSKDSKESKNLYVKALLPQGFDNPQILALAVAVDFSHVDDPETRAKKFMRLGLLIRDMYDHDNAISRNLGLHLIPVEKRLQPIFMSWLLAESFERATEELAKVQANISNERAIDFNLSYAQVLFWRLFYGRQSPVHALADFEMEGNVLALGMKSQRVVEAILLHVAKAESLIEDSSIELPVLYHSSLYNLAKNLTADQKYDLITMHKGELDEARMIESSNPLEALNRARGLDAMAKNPLDYFTVEKIKEVEGYAERAGVQESDLPRFVSNTMKNYALKKVVEPENYFEQDVLQRYLLKSGLVNREMIAQIITKKIHNLKQRALELNKPGVSYVVTK